jgi:hypothetical protein
MAKKRNPAQSLIASPGASPNQLRAWAYLGAWELVVDIVAEFPGILPQLNAALSNGHGTAKPAPLARISAAETIAIGDMVRQAPTTPAKRKYTPRAPKKPDGRRRRMTPAERRAISLRMRQRWADLRAAQAAKSKTKTKTASGGAATA